MSCFGWLLFSCCNKRSFCMNAGTGSLKLLLATGEKRDRSLRSELPGRSPGGSEPPTRRGSARGRRGTGTSPTAARFVPHNHSRKQDLNRNGSLPAAFLSHRVSFLPPYKPAPAAAGACLRQGGPMGGQRWPSEASQVPAPGGSAPAATRSAVVQHPNPHRSWSWIPGGKEPVLGRVKSQGLA